jgi:hypothetical protein
MAGEVSPEIRDYLFGYDVGTTLYKQNAIQGVVSGEVFELPAGSVDVAVGFNYREPMKLMILLENKLGLVILGVQVLLVSLKVRVQPRRYFLKAWCQYSI